MSEQVDIRDLCQDCLHMRFWHTLDAGCHRLAVEKVAAAKFCKCPRFVETQH